MFFTNNLYNKGKSRVHIALTQSTTLHLTGEQNMIITDIKIRKLFDEGPMKAVVSVTLDHQFAVHDIKIIEGEKGEFIAMPSRKNAEGEYRDVAHPINSETRTQIQELIMQKYREEIAEA